MSQWIDVGTRRWAARALALALIYGATARLGWIFVTAQTGVSPFWPSAGIGLALLLLWGRPLWPALFLGALASDLLHGVPWPIAASGAVTNTLETFTAAWMLSRWPGFDTSLRRLHDVIALITAGAIASLLGAIVGTTLLLLFGSAIVVDPTRVAPIWWAGDAMGILVFAPPVLAWAHWRPGTIQIGRTVEGAALIVALALTTFLTLLPSTQQIAAMHSAIEYLPFPLVVWAAMRFGMRGATAAALVISFFALWHFSISPLEWQLLGPDHALLLVQTSVSVIVLTALIIASVLMERDAAARALAESETRYRTLYNHTPVMLHSIDPEGRLVAVSDYWLREMGYSREEVLGRRSVEFLTDASRAYAIGVVLPEFFRTGEIKDVEYQFVRKDGTVMDILMSAVSERGADDAIVKSMAVLMDVTARKRAERERQQIEIKLQQAQRLESLGLLAGGIAHDFNNLLTSILGSANLARHQLGEEALAQHLEQIEQSAERAADLCRQMLAYAGQGPFHLRPHDLGTTILETLKHMAPSIGKGVTLDLSVATDLPTVECDTTQIRQLITNLVMNAAESIVDAAADVTGNADDKMADAVGAIRVRADRVFAEHPYLASSYLAPDLPSGTYVRLEVSDTGKGMTSATLARIFDPFFTTKFMGRGLGLSAVLGIVRSHRGAIWVESKPGQGATFRVLLPAIHAEARRGVAAPPTDATASAFNSAGLALVIDDEPSVRAVTKRMVEACGMSVRTANDGSEGLELFRECQRDVSIVLLDLTMPGMSGDEVFAEIRKLNTAVPIVLMTGFSERDAAARTRDRNFACLLQKPFGIQTMRDVLQQVLPSRS